MTLPSWVALPSSIPCIQPHPLPSPSFPPKSHTHPPTFAVNLPLSHAPFTFPSTPPLHLPTIGSSFGVRFLPAPASSQIFSMGHVGAAFPDALADHQDCERRPCGMVVQLRDANPDQNSPSIRLKISYGDATHDLSIAAYSTFGDLKQALVQYTGLRPQQQRLFFKGKEKHNKVYLHDAGVRNKSKIILVEDHTRLEQVLSENEALAKTWKALTDVQEEVDQLADKVYKVEASVKSGRRLRESAFTESIELLMCQLLKLDGISAEGNAKTQRRILVRRVQKYVETLDVLKLRNDSSKNTGTTTRPNSVENT